ncbi:MAG: hypothetical protein FJX67_18020 [Alphaproteobacteria bacterium]|nr:hypothetical protein [Alphaproteobacteria bacterium]
MRAILALVVAALVLARPAPGAATQLVADLSSREIAITTGFAGTELLLFGAVDGPGDIIVVVRGPRRDQIVRRKVEVAGIWINGPSARFADVPAFYWVASTGPLTDIAEPAFLAEREIGFAQLRMPSADGRSAAATAPFRTAMVRLKDRVDLYEETTGVVVAADRLFRTSVVFPANLPTGDYRAEVYLLRDKRLVSTETIVIDVHRVGLGARIHGFATRDAALYGIMAIAIALVAGWLAGVIFRKG